MNAETNESAEVACSTQCLRPSVNTGRLSSEGNHLGVCEKTGHARLLEKGGALAFSWKRQGEAALKCFRFHSGLERGAG